MAYIKLNKSHFFNNLDIIARQTKSIDKIALVLKDNAYGHGLLELSTMAKEYGVTKAVVKDEQEARAIEDFFEYILVLAPKNPIPNSKFCYTINSLESIKLFPKNSNVELKTDSGMHRNGVSIDELESAFGAIKKAELNLVGVFSHHKSADELSSEWFWQRKNFEDIKKLSKDLAKRYGFNELRFHSSNSAALFRCENFDEDMARVGIAAYGCLEMPKSFGTYEFKPILSLFATKNSTRTLTKGSRIGYGGDGFIKQDSIVSNYDLGYGDGFFRAMASANYKTPKGYELVGRVSMDNSSFLSSDGEILVFDDARVVASYAKTISYEVLTSLKAELKRVIV
ncbi:MAG: alanine racemase [Sulfurimonas sp.]|jgi:alanine racemase|nr:alanine racemase [Sulfurimonadaceae bacterium]